MRLAQSLAALDKALMPVGNAVTLPFVLVPLFGMPSPATLDALQNRH